MHSRECVFRMRKMVFGKRTRKVLLFTSDREIQNVRCKSYKRSPSCLMIMLFFEDVREIYSFWTTIVDAPPPPLQIPAHPNSPGFNWCNNVTIIREPLDLPTSKKSERKRGKPRGGEVFGVPDGMSKRNRAAPNIDFCGI